MKILYICRRLYHSRLGNDTWVSRFPKAFFSFLYEKCTIGYERSKIDLRHSFFWLFSALFSPGLGVIVSARLHSPFALAKKEKGIFTITVIAGYLQLSLSGVNPVLFSCCLSLFLSLSLCSYFPLILSFPLVTLPNPGATITTRKQSKPLKSRNKMFVFHPKDLPPDPIYPADLKKLGYEPGPTL